MFSRNRVRMGCTPMVQYLGHGYFAGEAPLTADPDEPDGRFRRLNVPGRGRIEVYERSTMTCVRTAISASDGTWRVEHLRTDFKYTVIGFDDTGLQNAAIQDFVVPADMG